MLIKSEAVSEMRRLFSYYALRDNLTKEVFVFRSPMNDILQSNLAGLISEWNLLPH
jgi:hypothetical protein